MFVRQQMIIISVFTLQAVIAKLQEVGLKSAYSKAKYEYLGRVVRGLLSLALVPLDRVGEGFGIVQDYANNVDPEIHDKVQQLIKYFYNTWMNGHYKIETWNFFAAHLQRTNNVSEGFNHILNNETEFGGTAAHPNIWLLIKVIKKHLIRTKQKAEQLEVGQDPRHRRGAVNSHVKKEEARHAFMLKLTKGKILLPDYMDAVGRSSMLLLTRSTYTTKRPETGRNTADDANDIDHETPASKSGGQKSASKSSGKKNSDKKTPNPSTSSGKKEQTKSTDKKTPNPSTSSGKKEQTKSSDKKTPNPSTSSGKKVTSKSSKSGKKKAGKLYHLTGETPTKSPKKG